MPSIGPISSIAPLDLFVGPMDPRLMSVAMVNVANAARATQFQVNRTITVAKATVNINTSSGNLDLGILDNAGNRLGSTGSVASPGTGGRKFSLTAPVTLFPGQQYWAVYSTDNATGKIFVAPFGPVVTAAPDMTTATLGLYWLTSFPIPSLLTIGSGTSDVFGPIILFSTT